MEEEEEEDDGRGEREEGGATGGEADVGDGSMVGREEGSVIGGAREVLACDVDGFGGESGDEDAAGEVVMVETAVGR